jgi:hypothetical protein
MLIVFDDEVRNPGSPRFSWRDLKCEQRVAEKQT